jgi:GNAT superfamily N-acetyltransferase
MHVQTRQAQLSDAPLIAGLVGELLHEIMTVIGSRVFTFDPAATETRVRVWLADQKYSVFLACPDRSDEAVGLLALYESYALYAEGAFGTIPELYVRPAYRSRGIGAALLAAARQFARSRQWTRLEVTTPPLPQFERTLAFYERQGFTVSGGRKMKTDVP